MSIGTKTSRTKQIEQANKLDPLSMRDYAKLVKLVAGENKQDGAKNKNVKNTFHLKIKSSKAFESEDAHLIKNLVEKVKQS